MSVMRAPPAPRARVRSGPGCLLRLRPSSRGLGLDVGVLDEEVERLGSDDIAGQRHDLAAPVELRGEFLRIAAVGLGERADLGADLVGRDLDVLLARDGLQDEVGLDGAHGVVAGVLAEPRLVPSLRLQDLLEREPAARPRGGRLLDPVLGLVVARATSGRSTSTLSTSAASDPVADDRRRPRAPSAPGASRAGPPRSSSSVSNSLAVLAKSSSASGSFLALTSFTRTWKSTGLPGERARRTLGPSDLGRTQDVARASCRELGVELGPNSPEPTP